MKFFYTNAQVWHGWVPMGFQTKRNPKTQSFNEVNPKPTIVHFRPPLLPIASSSSSSQFAAELRSSFDLIASRGPTQELGFSCPKLKLIFRENHPLRHQVWSSPLNFGLRACVGYISGHWLPNFAGCSMTCQRMAKGWVFRVMDGGLLVLFEAGYLSLRHSTRVCPSFHRWLRVFGRIRRQSLGLQRGWRPKLNHVRVVEQTLTRGQSCCDWESCWSSRLREHNTSGMVTVFIWIFFGVCRDQFLCCLLSFCGHANLFALLLLLLCF